MTTANVRGERIYSRLGDDPDLADIVEMFVSEVPDRVTTLLERLDKEDWSGLQQLAHQLKGAAGSYGFDVVTPAAGRLESALRDGEPEAHVRQAVADLIELCGRLRAGSPSSG